jgi:hypothetical protein
MAQPDLRGLSWLLAGRLSLCGLDRCILLNLLAGLIRLRTLRWTFKVLPGLVEFFVKFLTGFPKLVHALTQTPRELGKLLRAEKNKHDDKN